MALVQMTRDIVVNSDPNEIGRLLFNLEMFKTHMADVRSIEIVERHPEKNQQVTRWNVAMDGVDLEWLETEQLDVLSRQMNFCLVEGDFKIFGGRWDFSERQPLPDGTWGTRVSLSLYYDLGLPAFDDLIGDVLERRVLENTLSLLEALQSEVEGGSK